MRKIFLSTGSIMAVPQVRLCPWSGRTRNTSNLQDRSVKEKSSTCHHNPLSDIKRKGPARNFSHGGSTRRFEQSRMERILESKCSCLRLFTGAATVGKP